MLHCRSLESKKSVDPPFAEQKRAGSVADVGQNADGVAIVGRIQMHQTEALVSRTTKAQ